MIIFQNFENIIPDEALALFSEAAVNEVLLDIAEAARHEWITIAQKELFTSRRDYVSGIQEIAYTPGRATISLVGVLPNLIEDGMDETDMHDTLLGPGVAVSPPGSRGKHARKDGGYYRSIPFRHSGPTSGGATGQPMGRPYGGHEAVADAKKLGKAIYGAAKQMVRHSPGVMGKAKGGGRLPAGMAPKLQKYHATDIYAGMIRQEKTYRKATQSQYTTFRTIAVDSTGTPVGRSPWIRPRTQGRHFAQRVNEFVTKIAPQAFAAYAEGASS